MLDLAFVHETCEMTKDWHPDLFHLVKSTLMDVSTSWHQEFVRDMKTKFDNLNKTNKRALTSTGDGSMTITMIVFACQ